MFVLASTILAAAGLALVALSGVLFDELPPGFARARLAIAVLVALAAVLLLLEWVRVH